MHLRFFVGLIASIAVVAAAAPCYGRLNETIPFEEVCYTVLKNGTDGLSLRKYGASGAAMLVEYQASSSITVYQEALTLTTFYVIEYFLGPGNVHNDSLLSARTVPLVLRPPTPAHNFWVAHMALTPSRYPPATPPAPYAPTTLRPLGENTTLAVQRATLAQSPQPSDFDALCAKLSAGIKEQLPGWSVDTDSPYTPSHARYYSYYNYEGPWTIECWMGVAA
jgi:hypothetical protein